MPPVLEPLVSQDSGSCCRTLTELCPARRMLLLPPMFKIASFKKNPHSLSSEYFVWKRKNHSTWVSGWMIYTRPLWPPMLLRQGQQRYREEILAPGPNIAERATRDGDFVDAALTLFRVMEPLGYLRPIPKTELPQKAPVVSCGCISCNIAGGR